MRGVVLVWLMLMTEAVAAQPLPTGTGNYIAIELQSGRLVAGWIDERSDESFVWLRTGAGRVVLVSGFARHEIVGWAPVPPPRALLDSDHPAAVIAEPSGLEPLSAARSLQREALLRPDTEWLDIVAFPDQWDRDAEIDGITLLLQPSDAQGRITPISGRVDARLLAVHQRWTGGSRALDRDRFLELERWSVIVPTETFQRDGYRIRLPFLRFQPERDLHVAPAALVAVRLSVPGHGVFEAADDWVHLRSSSPFRDELRLRTGRRTLPSKFLWRAMRCPDNR